MGAARAGFAIALVACTASPEPPPSTLFVSDYRPSAVIRYDGTTGEFVDVFAQGMEQRIDRPANVRRGPDGHLYVAGFGRGDVVRYDLSSGDLMDVFFWDTRLLEEPIELEFRGEHLFVLGNDTKNLVELDARGAVVKSFGDPTMRGAQDFVIDGDLAYVATESHPALGSAIQVWDLSTGTLARHFASYDEVAWAGGLVLHEGVLYVSDWERARVTRFDAATGESLGVLVDESALTGPVDVDIAPDGALCVLDTIGLHRFDRATGAPLGRLISVADGILESPFGFAFVVD